MKFTRIAVLASVAGLALAGGLTGCDKNKDTRTETKSTTTTKGSMGAMSEKKSSCCSGGGSACTDSNKQ